MYELKILLGRMTVKSMPLLLLFLCFMFFFSLYLYKVISFIGLDFFGANHMIIFHTFWLNPVNAILSRSFVGHSDIDTTIAISSSIIFWMIKLGYVLLPQIWLFSFFSFLSSIFNSFEELSKNIISTGVAKRSIRAGLYFTVPSYVIWLIIMLIYDSNKNQAYIIKASEKILYLYTQQQLSFIDAFSWIAMNTKIVDSIIAVILGIVLFSFIYFISDSKELI